MCVFIKRQTALGVKGTPRLARLGPSRTKFESLLADDLKKVKKKSRLRKEKEGHDN